MPWASNPEKRFRLSPSAPEFQRVWLGSGREELGVVLSTRLIIERPLVRPQLPGPSFNCGQVNRCHAGLISHASGGQLASPQPIFWGSRSMGGPLACNQQMRVRFPPLPPSSPGRPLRSRRRSEKPDKHVRLVPLAPSVTVAEWLRRQTVDLSTRVQFPPVTPIVRASFNG